jgi:hypothetical protein
MGVGINMLRLSFSILLTTHISHSTFKALERHFATIYLRTDVPGIIYEEDLTKET